MSKPVIVDSDIKLPNKDSDVSVTLVEKGAAHVGFGIDLFLGQNLVRSVVKFPDEDDVGTAFLLDTAIALRGMNLDCYGRVFSAVPDTIELRLEFSIDGKIVARSTPAKITLTAADPSREFHLRCEFV